MEEKEGPQWQGKEGKVLSFKHWLTILVAVITAGFAFWGFYMSNRKQAALVSYRLEKLEVRVDKHNKTWRNGFIGWKTGWIS